MGKNSNFHSHCTFCDGRSHPEDFVLSAIAHKFRAYGFSSHSPLPFETHWNMSGSDLPAYIEEVNRLKKKYAGRLEIYLALEIDYLDNTYGASIDYFRLMPLDYRISAIHFLPRQHPLTEENMVCIDGGYKKFEEGVNRHYGGSIRRMTEHFFESSMQMVEAGGFDIVGHVDKIYMNGSRHPDFDMQADWYRKPFLDLLDFIAEKKLIVEINSKNKIRKGQTYPHLHAYKELKKRHIPVMVNSDCHFPDLVNGGRDETLSALQEAGFRTTRELVNGKWEDVEICPP
jgi:histidinol-phosphatase (PHP family)